MDTTERPAKWQRFICELKLINE